MRVLFLDKSVWSCSDVSTTFHALMQLSLRGSQALVVVQLCEIYFKHQSLILWYTELLRDTITFLSSQCSGDGRSRFIATAIPLAELAIAMNVYPRLAEMNGPGHRVLRLWDFMSQAEIYTLLCVFFQSVHRRFGLSQASLDFTIVCSRHPSDIQSRQPESGAISGKFVEGVECALANNLHLSRADIRRVSANEWRVMIADITRIIDVLPFSISHVTNPAVSADRRRPSAAEPRASSSVSSSSDSWVTPKKVLLETPLPTRHSNVVSHPLPPTMSSVSGMPSSVLQTDRRAARGTVPVLPVTPLQASAVLGDKRGFAPSNSAPASGSVLVVDYVMPPPQQSSSFLTSNAYHSALFPDRQRSAPLQSHAFPQNLASAAGPEVLANRYSSVPSAASRVMSGPAVMPSNMSDVVSIGPSPQSTSVNSSVFSSYINAAALPVTTSASFQPYCQQSSLGLSTTWAPSPVVARSPMTTAGSSSYVFLVTVSPCQLFLVTVSPCQLFLVTVSPCQLFLVTVSPCQLFLVLQFLHASYF